MASFSATTRSVRLVNVVAAVWMCCLLANSCSVFVLAKGKPDMKLTFYVHEKNTPPGATLILVDPLGGDLNNLSFGSVVIIDNVVRETISPNSTYLGRQLGTFVVGNDNFTFGASFTILLNTTSYAGSISMAGISQSGILVVTGGTDTFSFARGVAYIQTLVNTAATAIYEYNLDLKF